MELAVLAVLSRGETYGYDILAQLEDAGLSGVGDASVYGTLRRLEEAGHLHSRLATSASGPARKYYTVTETGRQSYVSGADTWCRIERAVDLLMNGSRS
ncbi:MAG TPA: PadR family transcriptional regulator [Gaiellaceae bacterium]|nr:PadR family transcriptional regulator [Gaiellaceae bacterium]